MIYYLRCIESDYPQLIALGELLGVIKQVDGEVVATNIGDNFNYIGTIPVLTGNVILDADGNQLTASVPRTDADGNVYVHANLMTTTNLRDAAEALAVQRPEIASALSNLSKYFVVDADGNATAPAQPFRIFAT